MLVIVESPIKAKKIYGFLKSKYKDVQVLSTFGHFRDLPRKSLAVNLKTLKPGFVILKPKVADRIKKDAKDVDVIIATDPDREGEAIAYHIAKIIGKRPKSIQRVDFRAIEYGSVMHQLENPREIDNGLVDSWKARRVADRLVGYLVSPQLWKRMKKHWLSAGRVQSCVLKAIVEREHEIKNFESEPYWNIIVTLPKKVTLRSDPIYSKKEAVRILKLLKKHGLRAKFIEKKEEEFPFPPFISSTMQQDCGMRYKWTPDFTMKIAQRLFENGFITYHRTDSARCSAKGIKMVRKYIEENYVKYHRDQPVYRKGKGRDAHECIRPTKIRTEEKDLPNDEKKQRLYTLIQNRFIASQAKDALWLHRAIRALLNHKNHGKIYFRADSWIILFDGWRHFYQTGRRESEKALPKMESGVVKPNKFKKIAAEENETKPPWRYNIPAVIKWMESNGVGRPSTYANIVSTLARRKYVIVSKKVKVLIATDLGKQVIEELEDMGYSWLLSAKTTAILEDKLDKIASGKIPWKKVVRIIQKRLPS
jgi:DNA topoisomerase-1